MKREILGINELNHARDALDDALQSALTLMHQKSAEEATVTLAIAMEMRDDGGAESWIPKIKYKVSVNVPVKYSLGGQATNASQVYWDRDLCKFMIATEGEQVRI